MKTSDVDLAQAAGKRLHAIWDEIRHIFNLETVDDYAEFMGVGRNALSNWLNGYHPPTIHAMIRLCDKSGVTLDWIYRGSAEGLAYGKTVRLEARVRGENPPMVAEEPSQSGAPKELVSRARKRAKASENAPSLKPPI